MKQTCRLLLVFWFATGLFQISKAYSPVDENITESPCYYGDCLLCYLSLPLADPRIQDIISFYELESLFGMMLKNSDKGIVFGIKKGKINNILIEKHESFRDIPLGIKPNTSRAELLRRFGPSKSEYDHIYRFYYGNGIDVKVFYQEDSDYSIVLGVQFWLIENYGMKESCFANGSVIQNIIKVSFSQEEIFANALNRVLLSGLEGFGGSDTVSFGSYGNGWLFEESFALLAGKADTKEEALQIVKDFDEMLGNLVLPSFALKIFPEGITESEAMSNDYRGRMPVARTSGIDESIEGFRLWIILYEQEDTSFKIYMQIYPPES